MDSAGNISIPRPHIILDHFFQKLSADPEAKDIDELASELALIFDFASKCGELREFKAACRNHRLHELIMHDPYSRRAFEKPRGYAGDAIMLDYIYRPESLNLSQCGNVVHQATTRLPSAQSIIWRRDFIASLIETTIVRIHEPNILSVASGHMRELDRLNAHNGASFWALDQDEMSLCQAIASYPCANIRAINEPISFLLKSGIDERFDLIYSAGLFDYLPDKIAVRLIKRLFDHLAPCGSLVIANFAPNNHGRGFMSGMMDWDLIYRSKTCLSELVTRAVPHGKPSILNDGLGQVVYAALFK